MLRHLGVTLEQLGDKMVPKSAKMRQDSAQERQHESTSESIEQEARLNGNCWIRILHCLSLSVSFNPCLFLSVSVLIAYVPVSLCFSLAVSVYRSVSACLSLPASVCRRLSLFASMCL